MFALPADDLVVPSAVRSRHSSSKLVQQTQQEPLGRMSGGEFRKNNFEVPLSISKRFRDVKYKTLVGLSALVPCAIYSVDDTVILWRFKEGKESSVQCDGVVTCVSLGVPAPFVFPVSVKFVLAVATENSVSIFPLDADLKQTKSDGFFLPLPHGGFTQISVTVTGRILLWSAQEASTLYELRYRASCSWFKSKVFFQYHSLISGAASGVVGTIAKIMSTLIAPPPKLLAAAFQEEESIKLWIQPESSFRFFVSLDSVSVSLFELADSLTPFQAATASWRHVEAHSGDLLIKCVGKMQLADLGSARVLFANVAVAVDSGEPFVELVTDQAELVTLRCVSDSLVVHKSRSHAVLLVEKFSKKNKLSLSCATAVGQDLFATAQGTELTLSAGDSSTVFELNAAVLAVTSERLADQDIFGSFVIPALSASEASGLIKPCGSATASPIIVLTGKGVTVLDPVEPSSVAAPVMPRSVSEIVKILSSSAPVMFAHKPMFIRAITDEVQVSSLQQEQDYCAREKALKPVSFGIWIAGVKRMADSVLFAVRREPMLTKSAKQEVRVAVSQRVLESVGTKIRNLVKFTKLVLSSVPAQQLKSTEVSCAHERRQLMHAGQETREQVLKQQAAATLRRIIDSVSFSGEVLSFFALVDEYNSSGAVLPPEAAFVQERWTVSDFRIGDLSRICENFIKANSARMTELVEKLKLVCPSILCAVSPALVPFSPEGIAAMLQCAVANNSPIAQVLEAVKTLARSTPSVASTLTIVTKIIRSLEEHHDKECVLEAALDGLQERLIDASVVREILSWTAACLSEKLNEFVFDYLFSRGNWEHIDVAADRNQWIEKYLASRLLQNHPSVPEVYAKVVARAGRANIAGEVLEKAAFISSEKNISLFDRIALLEKAQAIFPVHRRMELAAIAKHVQLPLSQRVQNLDKSLSSISDLFQIAQDEEFWDIALTCYLFVPVKESEVIRMWSKCLFMETCFSKKFVSSYLHNLHEISKQVESFSIWRKPELIAALLEYLSCIAQAEFGWVARDFLIATLRLTPQQAIEVYSKIIRELSVWMLKVPPRSHAPSQDQVKARLVHEVVSLAEAELHSMHAGQLQSVLILIKNHLKQDHFDALNKLVDHLAAAAQGSSAPSLPAI